MHFPGITVHSFSTDAPCGLLVSFRVFSSLFALSLCLLMGVGRAGMSMDRGISGLLKDFRAIVQCGLLCVLRG